MTTPRCPICLKRYSGQRIPYILQPCSHGLCKQCADEYIVRRESTSCPTCRATILRHTVNYDLKEVCTGSLEGWKEALMESLCKTPGVHVTIEDSILPAAQLIVNRISGNRNFHDSLITLVRNSSTDDAYSWVEALQFPADWEVERKLTKLIRHHEFLEKYSAGWVLEFI